MTKSIKAWAAAGPGKPFERFSYEPGPLKADEVEIQVEYCGLCHSDLSMWQNEWGMSAYPLVPGHEVVGRIVARGGEVRGLADGERVGLGWFARSCMHCAQCLTGDDHLCPTVEATIVGRHGGFAERVRCHWAWAVPLPEALPSPTSGPLFCGGITVFSPLIELGLRPVDRAGVVGIGGLGHLALQYLRAWGCEVTAFTSRAGKARDLESMGAHRVVASTDERALADMAGSLDLLLVTTSAALDWPRFITTLAPRGHLHFVGAVLEPLNIGAFSLIAGQKSVSGSPFGRISTLRHMLDFSERHKIAPIVEHFPMSRVNDALDHLHSGKARYRIVLDADF
ncbi:NAD(P)-dependent alcohol dehydrogenase [Acidiferrobacter sp.]|uniref:NADPH-dependent aldehyde reductase Ahr n=1 Tax=Acidiferrobacter sp. TaxID=1872107 RepID=UPI00260807D3|nr:NAD(P)-dependent alcohol dehydrogenase [Acidiferrobacter sp.]